jgi:hypothetical protein
MLVRGGKYFPGFCHVLFVGSLRNGSALERHTIEIGLPMMFFFDELVIVTSAVESVARHSASADTTYCPPSGTSDQTDQGASHDERRGTGDADQQLDAGDGDDARTAGCPRSGW